MASDVKGNGKNTFENTVENLFKGMDGFITTKTVVGDAIHHSKLVTVKGQDSISKILDMVPDIISKFSKSDKKGKEKDVEIPEDVFDSVK